MIKNFTVFNHNNDGIIDNIYIFCEDIDFCEDKINSLKTLYVGLKIKIIQKSIFEDDSIFDIKNKISIYCNDVDIENMYLYGIQTYNYKLEDFFNNNSNDEGLISYDKLQQSKLVFNREIENTSYTYSELLDIVVPNKRYVSLGIVLDDNISVDPFLYKMNNTTEFKEDKSLKLLKDYNLDEDIKLVIKGNVDNIYFNDTKTNFDKKIYENKYNLIDSIYKNSNLESMSKEKINFINFKITNKVTNLKLNKIFMNFNVTEDLPLVKYNPSERKDRIFRLYAPYRSYNNQKIPFLNKTIINKFIIDEKGRYKTKYLTFYHIINTDILTTIILTLNENDTFDVTFESQKDYTIDKIKDYVNEFIKKLFINIYDTQIIKYKNNVFEDFNDIDLKIKNMNYKFSYKCKKPCNEILKYLKNNVSYPFKLIESNRKGDLFIFKRISINDTYSKIFILCSKSNELEILVTDVNSILYFNNIKIYLSGLIEIIQNDLDKNMKSLIKNVSKNFDSDYVEINEIKEVNEDDYEEDNYFTEENLKKIDENNEIKKNVTYDRKDEETKEKDTKEEETKEEERKEEETKEEERKEEETKAEERKEEETKVNKKITYDSDDDIDMGFIWGGAKSRTNMDSYFINQIERLDPNLFEKNKIVTEKQIKKKEWNPYTRTCGNSEQRQPIIITGDEKTNIDKNHEGSYGSKVLKYSSDPDNLERYYICPKFWCIDKRISLRDDQVKKEGEKYISDFCKDSDNNYGQIIYFNKNRINDKTGQYNFYYPDFNKKSCLPCCGKKLPSLKEPPMVCNMDSNENIDEMLREERNDENIEDSERDLQIGDLEREDETIVNERDDKIKKDIIIEKQKSSYIKKPETVPLQANHWGKLSDLILNTIKIEDYNNKSGYLRNGVNSGNHNNQSFIACISTLYAYSNKKQKKSINMMKEHIINSIDIDMYSNLSSGDLISIFFDESYEVSEEKMKKYKSSRYSKDKNIFKRLINSYENFCKYLMSDRNIDHKYIWDIICQPNEKLFKSGCNLIILEEDIYNVNLICPFNKYLTKYDRFDVKKPSFLIIRNMVKDHYEPVVYYKNENNLIYLKLHFYIDNDNSMGIFLKKINKIFNQNNYCGIIPDKKLEEIDVSNYYKNISINNKLALNKYSIPIMYQVLDRDLKNIGFVIIINNNNLYLPNNPSDKIDDISIIFMNQVEFIEKCVLDYKKTKDILNYVSEYTKNEIYCKPISKIVTDDNIIIGILTYYGNFIKTIHMEDYNDELITDKNYYSYIEVDNKEETRDIHDIDYYIESSKETDKINDILIEENRHY